MLSSCYYGNSNHHCNIIGLLFLCIKDKNMEFNEPAGWIPPEFREFIYADKLSESDIAAIRASSYSEDEFGNRTPLDLNKVSRLIGVKDTRTGLIQYNQHSQMPFLTTDIS